MCAVLSDSRHLLSLCFRSLVLLENIYNDPLLLFKGPGFQLEVF